MKYVELEGLLSPKRLGRYNSACNDHILKTMSLYRANIRISQAFHKLLVNLSFGFWKHMFAGKQYRAGGNTLLAIFPNLQPKRNQGFIYQRLHLINSIRNRIAHHEPICFGAGNTISATYARAHYKEIIDILNYMNIDSRRLFAECTDVLEEANYIDNI